MSDLSNLKTFYGVYLNDWSVTWGTIANGHYLLLDEYLPADVSAVTYTSWNSNGVTFIYPHNIKKNYVLEGVVDGWITMHGWAATSRISDYQVSILKINQDATETTLATTPVISVNDLLGSSGSDITYPYYIDVFESGKDINEYDRLAVRVKWNVSHSSTATARLLHDNDSTWNDFKINIPNGFFCIYQEPIAKNLFLYPNGNFLNSMVSVGGSGYACVDEARDVPDNDDTYVYTASTSNVSDIYTLQDSTVGGTINYVQAYANAKSHLYSQHSTGIYKIFLDLAGVHSLSNDFDLTTDYGLYNKIFFSTPSAGAWTWASVNNLRLGILANSPVISAVPANAIFRPNAAGDRTELTPSGAATNWECVAASDGKYTYITSFGGYDYYNVPNHTTETGPINSVTLFADSKYTGGSTPILKLNVKLYGTEYLGPEIVPTGAYATYSRVLSSSPSDASTWNWGNIDNIQIGTYNYFYVRVEQIWMLVNYDLQTSPQIRTTQAYIKVNYTSAASCYFLRQPETYTLSHDRNITKFNTWSEHIVRDDGRNSKNLTLNGCEYESQATYRLRLVRTAVEEGLDCTFYGLFDGNLNTDWHIKSFNYDRDAQNPNLWNWSMSCEEAVA
jgi:hypothetical protein